MSGSHDARHRAQPHSSDDSTGSTVHDAFEAGRPSEFVASAIRNAEARSATVAAESGRGGSSSGPSLHDDPGAVDEFDFAVLLSEITWRIPKFQQFFSSDDWRFGTVAFFERYCSAFGDGAPQGQRAAIDIYNAFRKLAERIILEHLPARSDLANLALFCELIENTHVLEGWVDAEVVEQAKLMLLVENEPGFAALMREYASMTTGASDDADDLLDDVEDMFDFETLFVVGGAPVRTVPERTVPRAVPEHDEPEPEPAPQPEEREEPPSARDAPAALSTPTPAPPPPPRAVGALPQLPLQPLAFEPAFGNGFAQLREDETSDGPGAQDAHEVLSFHHRASFAEATPAGLRRQSKAMVESSGDAPSELVAALAQARIVLGPGLRSPMAATPLARPLARSSDSDSSSLVSSRLPAPDFSSER